MILTAGGANSISTRVHYFYFFFFFAQTAEEITHFITGIDRAGGFLKSHVHLENNCKVVCKNFEEHSRLCVPIHVYCVYAKFRSKRVILLQVK